MAMPTPMFESKAMCYRGGMEDPRSWGGRWHGCFPLAFFWTTGGMAFGFVLNVSGWSFDPAAIVFVVVPLGIAVWALLMLMLFLPLALVSAALGACLDVAQRVCGRA